MSMPSNQSLSSQASGDGRVDLTTESVSRLRSDIEQTRESMSYTLDAIERKLTPRQVAAQATGALAVKAQHVAADAAGQANQLALAVRDQTRRRARQVRGWYAGTSTQYPWFPAALLGSALVASALVLWQLNARRG